MDRPKAKGGLTHEDYPIGGDPARRMDVMAWVYLDDQFFDHPKVALAGGDAAWLYVAGLGYCKRFGTEGRIPIAQVSRLTDRPKPSLLADRLVEVRLWESDGDHYVVHDYADWNKPAESRSAAGRKAAAARWDKERNANAYADASDSHSDRIPDADASECPAPHPFTDPLDQCAESAVTLRAVPDEPDELPLKARPDLSYARTVAAYLLRHGFSLDSEGGKLTPTSYRLIVSHVDHTLGDGHPKRTWALLRLVADYVEAMTGTEVSREAQSHLGRLVKSYGPSAALYGMTQAVTWGAGIGKSYEDDPLAITKYATSVCAKAAS